MALNVSTAGEVREILGKAIVQFGHHFLFTVRDLSAVDSSSGSTDRRWKDLDDAATQRFVEWLNGDRLTRRVDEDDRRAVAAYQMLDLLGGERIPVRLVAKVIVALPEGHPLRDTVRARALVDDYLAQDDIDPDTRLMTLALLAGHLSDEVELPVIEARAARLFDVADAEAVLSYHLAVAGRAITTAVARRDVGDDAGRMRCIDDVRPHLEALEQIGGPRALLALAAMYETVGEVGRAAPLYETVGSDPSALPETAFVATLSAGRAYALAGNHSRVVELLQPAVPELLRRYVDAISTKAVADTGRGLARACEHLVVALACLGRWDDVTRILDTPKSARFRARQALRATAAGQRLLELEQLILDVERGVPVDLPPPPHDPGDRLRAGVPTLSTLQEAYQMDRPPVDGGLQVSPGIGEIAGVLESDELAVVLATTYSGTVVIVIDNTSLGGYPRAMMVEPSLTTRDWMEMLAGENDDGWIYALGGPEADLDRPLALQRLLGELDRRFAPLLVSLLGESPARVCIVPHSVLHLVPFHALDCLASAVVVTAPSAAQLVRDRRQPVPMLAGHLLAVANPTLDLALSASEAHSAELFAAAAGLAYYEVSGLDATKTAVASATKAAGLVHLSGHGQSDIVDPERSALLLALPPELGPDPFPSWLAAAEKWVIQDEEFRRATVPGIGALEERRLLDGDWLELAMNLPGRHTIWSWERAGRPPLLAERWSTDDLAVSDAFADCALAVLSACESALGGMNVGIDEYSGLPAALTLAGAMTVVATQWPIDEGVAAVAIELLYDELAGQRGTVDVAALVAGLRQRLRRMPRAEVVAVVERLRQRLTEPRARLMMEAMVRRLQRGPDEPFSRAWDWASFVVAGRGAVLRQEPQ